MQQKSNPSQNSWIDAGLATESKEEDSIAKSVTNIQSLLWNLRRRVNPSQSWFDAGLATESYRGELHR